MLKYIKKLELLKKNEIFNNPEHVKPVEREFVKFMGVKINNCDYEYIYKTIRELIGRNRVGFVCVTDVGNVIAATKDNMLFKAINNSLLSIADGTPLVWFARLAGCKKIERISGMDLMVKLMAEQDNYKHFFLGDTEETINRVIEKAKKINKRIRLSGYSPPFKDFDENDNEIIVNKINIEAPDIIWVSFGGGKQEKWMHANYFKLNKGVMIGVGAAFKWLIGDIKVPPKIMQKFGLQWTFRMAHEIKKNPRIAPRIVWRRQIKRFSVFISHFVSELIKARNRIRDN